MSPADGAVVVVGAGAAGLAAAATLARAGEHPIVLEAGESVGGSWARRYDRLHLHTVRRFSGLPFRPLPRTLPSYVPKDAYARYLAEHADAEGLDIRLGQRVERIEREGSHWLVRSDDTSLVAEAVVVATGKHDRPFTPSWPGLDSFRGRLLHSANYRTGSRFADEHVLVVGLGNSGAEIAADLVEAGAASVTVSIRTPPPIVRRQILGIPTQVFGIALAPFPPRAVDRAASVLRRLGTGDLTRYGIGPAAWGAFEARRPPVIDVGFLAVLKRGAVRIRSGVERLTETGVVFADGREERFDAIVAATGFTSGLLDLLDAPDVVWSDGMPAIGADGSSAAPGLFFIGLRESPRGALYEAGRTARRLAPAVAAYVRGGP